MTLPSKISVVEVGPRDGLQMEKIFVPTETKISLVNSLADAGIRKMEVTAFVSPRVIPQLQDAAEVFRSIHRLPGVLYLALVPNFKGAKRALDAGANAVKIVVCISETYNRRNVGMSVEQSLANSSDVFQLAKHLGKRAEAVIGLAFGCPLEGRVPPESVVAMTERLAVIGYREISIADSMGLANPAQVRLLMRLLLREFPHVHFALHLHNTRGLGLANALAGLEEGVDEFDSSIGGLGGSEVVVRGAGGNLATEDLLNMLHEMGLETGVDLQRVVAASHIAQQALGRPLSSYVLSVGTPDQFFQRVQQEESSS
jgi:hydroxymethylglutaryl-CoA lyase